MRFVLFAMVAVMLGGCVDGIELSPQCDRIAEAWCGYLDACGAIPNDRGTPEDTSDDFDDHDGCRVALFDSCQDVSDDDDVCLSEIEAVSRINIQCTGAGSGTPNADPPSACSAWFP